MSTEPNRREDDIDARPSDAVTRRAWSKPEMTVVMVISTESIQTKPGDGLTNLC